MALSPTRLQYLVTLSNVDRGRDASESVIVAPGAEWAAKIMQPAIKHLATTRTGAWAGRSARREKRSNKVQRTERHNRWATERMGGLALPDGRRKRRWAKRKGKENEN